MTDRPPSPSVPTPTPAIVADAAFEDRIVATTPQIAAAVAASFDCHLDEAAFEAVLLELDRAGYVEWVAVTRDGDHVWDLSEFPDRIADAVAATAVARLRSWLEGGDG